VLGAGITIPSLPLDGPGVVGLGVAGVLGTDVEADVDAVD